jgi:hypothetical protein
MEGVSPDGCLYPALLPCDVCREPIEPGDPVHCNDGYDRIYGEFVLGAVDDLHENNWPSAHQACAEGAAAPVRGGDVRVPRAVALQGKEVIARLARARLAGFVALAAAATAAVSATYWGGVGAGVAVLGAGAGLILVGWGLAARLRGD